MPQSIPEDVALVCDRLAFKVAVAGIRDSFPRSALCGFRVSLFGLAVDPLPRIGHDCISLIAELSGELPVGSQYFGRRTDLLLVTSIFRSNMLEPRAAMTGAIEVFAYLLTARAGGVKILLRVALDLRCAAAARLDFVTEIAEAKCHLRLIDSGGELLGHKQAALTQSSYLPVLALGHIKDDRVGVEVGRGIAAYGPGGVMLKLRGDKLACGLD